MPVHAGWPYADKEKMKGLWGEFTEIRRRLDELSAGGGLPEYLEYRLFDMTKKVLAHITRKYANLRKGAREIVGGRILEYPAKTIYNEGMAQGKVEVARRMLAANMSYEQVAEFTALPIEEIRVLN